MAQQIDAPGAVSRNSSNDRSRKRAKKNYTEVGLSNYKGSIRLGHVAKQRDVTCGVILQTKYDFSLITGQLFLPF